MLNNLFKNNKKISKNSKEKSRGRSMVEMLGVLAIIGVLSIGGISGYTIAMRKYRANEIVNIMTKYAFVLYSGFQNKVMNDPMFAKIAKNNLSPYYKDIPYFYQCEGTDSVKERNCLDGSFETSGLGGIPNGVSDIYPSVIGIDENGNTFVSLFVGFESEEGSLCATVKHLLGSLYQSDQEDECLNSSYIYNGIMVDTDHINRYSSYSND